MNSTASDAHRSLSSSLVLVRAAPVEEVLRRLCNIVFSLVALLILFPFFVVIALMIRLDSAGPVLFIQRRVGYDGREFAFYKFRSMTADAEARLNTVLDTNERTGPVFKARRDPRITRVGRVLRKYSLDELPQFINVLIGDMSLVGPRPALPREVAQYTPYQRQRLCVSPGLTGLWQVSGRAELTFEQAIALDMEYIRRRSLWLDLWILVRTLPAVLAARGAY